MSPRWTKMLRDMQTARGRLWMVVIALAASVAAVATMLSTYTVLMREVPRNYLGTNPASAQLELDGAVSDDLLARVRRRPHIAAAEAGTTVLARIQVGPDEWLPLMLFVVPGFEALHINTLHPEAGAWPPAPGTMVVERSALPLTRSALGGSVTVELPGAGKQALAISATVHDPGLAPAWQEQTVYGYVTSATLARLGEPARLDLLKIVVDDPRADLPSIEQTVRELTAWLTADGHAVQEARVPPPRLHPHQAQMNGVLAMLLIFSLLALLLGAVLTATVIGGLLAQQVRQIAIMKAIGARSRQLSSMYLGLVGVLGIAAVLIGLPLGLAAGRGFIALTAELLNLRIESHGLPPWLFAATLLLGLVVPLLAAWVPVRAAARRTVRQAIDDHGVSAQTPASSWLARALTRLRITDAALNLAVRNTFRRRTRLLLTLSLLSGAGAMFITSLNLEAAWEDNVTQAARDRHFDLEVRLQQPAPVDKVLAVASALPGVRHIEPWDVSRASIAGADALDLVHSYPDGAHGGFGLHSAPPDTRMVAHEMIDGRWLQPQDEDALVINSLAHAIAFRGVRVGDRVTLLVEHRPLTLRVVGITRELLTPGAAYVTPATFARATGLAGRTNALRLSLVDRGQADAVARRVVKALERERIGVKMVFTEKRFVAAQGGHVYILVFALGFIATLMAVVGLLGLASSLGTAVVERTREFAVMRAVGARSAAVMRSVLGEGMLTAALSCVAAIALSLLLSARVGSVLAAISTQELRLQLSPSGVGLWLLVVLLGSTVVSIAPARSASRLTVRQALSHT